MLWNALLVAVLGIACSQSTERARDREVGIQSVHAFESDPVIEVRFEGGAAGNLEQEPCVGEYELEFVETDD